MTPASPNTQGTAMLVDYYAYYLDFSRTLNISKTAQHFYMTPQGISRAVHALEKEFGLQLINREGNNVSLTEAGQALANEAERIIDAVMSAERRMTAMAQANAAYTNAPVNLITTAFCSKYVIPLLNLQAPKRFEFQLRIQESIIYRILPRFSQIATPHSFAMVSIPQSNGYQQMVDEAVIEHDLEYQPLLEVPLCAVVSMSSPFAGRKILRISDLKDCPVVCYNDPVLFDALTRLVNRDNIVMTTSSSQTLLQELEQNHAITFMPKLVSPSQIPKSTMLKCLKGAFSTRVGFLGAKGSFADPSIASVISYIREFFTLSAEQKNFQDIYELL